MYEKSITRKHKTAFIILIDQSVSMNGFIEYQNQMMTKATAVADVTNQIITELIERARRHDAIRDYYDVAICGYSDGEAVSLINTPNNHPFVSISELDKIAIGIKSRIVERIAPSGVRAPYPIRNKVWVEPTAFGDTPMYEAFIFAYEHIRRWCLDPNNRDSFPPIIINITDGISSDCDYNDLQKLATKIKELSTNDGNVFLINIHIASSSESNSMIFPTPDELKRLNCVETQKLGELSSTMPETFNALIAELKGCDIQQGIIGMSYNASIEEVLTIMNIGTISVKRG